MQRSGNIVRYTAEELDEMLRKGEDQTDVERIKALTEEELEASIDIEEEGEIDWETVIIGLPGPVLKLVFHIDNDVLDWFRQQGPGYQARMNDVLRSHIAEEKRRARAEARASR